MRPLGWIGLFLIVAGAAVVTMGGLDYTKSRNQVEVGSFKMTAEEKGLVPPIAGVAAIVVGVVLVLAGRKRAP
jgi:uncharacterized membrane protein YidH (DUF202 family)